MCYLFGRATKGVSLCPPAYYADLICDRGRCYLHGLFNSFDDTLSQKSGSSEEMERRVKDQAMAIWGEGIHPKLRGSMFYL